VDRRFGCRWTAFERELPQRQRWVTLSQFRDLLQRQRQLLELTGVTQDSNGPQLVVGGTARADEIRVVCVCEPIGARLRGSHNGALFE